MTKFFLAVIAALLLCNFVLYLLYKRQKGKAEANGELHEEALQRNISLAEQLGKLQAAEIIRSEERKNADEKINAAHRGNACSRFDAINGGLRKRTDS